MTANFPCSNIYLLQGHVPPLQRVVLDIFQQLRPPNHLPSLWTVFFQKLLNYLPNSDSSVPNGDAAKPVESRGSISGTDIINMLLLLLLLVLVYFYYLLHPEAKT